MTIRVYFRSFCITEKKTENLYILSVKQTMNLAQYKDAYCLRFLKTFDY